MRLRGPGSRLSDEERRRRKAIRNAQYWKVNRDRLIKDKRDAYAAKKADLLVSGPDKRVYNLELAHTMALRVERNWRYRGRPVEKRSRPH